MPAFNKGTKFFEVHTPYMFKNMLSLFFLSATFRLSPTIRILRRKILRQKYKKLKKKRYNAQRLSSLFNLVLEMQANFVDLPLVDRVPLLDGDRAEFFHGRRAPFPYSFV